MEILASVYWLTPEEGGRTHPIFSGYRAPCWFGLMMNGEEYSQLDPNHPDAHLLNRQLNDCVITYEGERESAMPGDECMIIARPHSGTTSGQF